MLTDLYVPYHTLPQGRVFLTSLMVRVGWNWVISRIPYGEAWRERRRMFTKYFHPGNTDLYEPTQMEFVRKMLPRLLKDPESFLAITRQ